MTASRKMYGSFLLFGVTFFVFDSVLRHGSTLVVASSGVASLLFFLYAMYVFYFEVTKGNKHLLKSGIKGTAVVLTAKQTHTLAQTGQFDFQAPFIWKYTLRVTLPHKKPYKAACTIANDSIREGATVQVVASRFNRKSVAIDVNSQREEAPAGTTAGMTDHVAERLTALSAARGTPTNREPTISVNGAPVDLGTLLAGTRVAKPDVADELTKLSDLRDRGALSDTEFEAQKAKLLATS